MKASRFTGEQIIGILKKAEAGMKAADVCREQGISEATFYKWKAKYGGLEVSEARRLKQLDQDNTQLKRIVADLTLDNVVLKDLLSKNVWSAARLQGKSEEDEVVRENVFGLWSGGPGHDENPHVPVLNNSLRSGRPVF